MIPIRGLPRPGAFVCFTVSPNLEMDYGFTPTFWDCIF